MPENDLALILGAAEAAGRIALGFWRQSPKVWEKPDAQGPVTEADLAVNAHLERVLRAARPGYGWLSEESTDSPARLDCATVFVLDPIDGTRSFIEGAESFSISLAVVTEGRPVAAVVHLPATGVTYAAHAGGPATRNGKGIAPRATPPLPQVLTNRTALEPEFWPGGVPPCKRNFRASLAWRFCLVAEGAFDGLISMRPAWEWDTAAGALIAERVGVVVSDPSGRPLVYNAAHPQAEGLLVAPPGLHGDWMARRRA
ncbi:3'(2'),5'-bisphosphate nucleotidase CysQ [Stagnihabitans tardus]|uniref:3'(2'),5'-bisphosphate nucleotidase CysQ n=1 Tax=Stagnihabitans tardus TaxID=2699202 RepID=A0AAE4YB46_9RHOB|nr:3'(2'),5'-bisphosphate nucleotidase CysQ [Stagnihabitans tardus]NBZ86695.1 3'(2'),5'-bisphosphate nucleotidase CysQ [Stagnihabitans tardus]